MHFRSSTAVLNFTRLDTTYLFPGSSRAYANLDESTGTVVLFFERYEAASWIERQDLVRLALSLGSGANRSWLLSRAASGEERQSGASRPWLSLVNIISNPVGYSN